MTAFIMTIFILFLAVFVVASILALYQLWQFGYVGDATRKIVIIYVLTGMIIIVCSVIIAMAVR